MERKIVFFINPISGTRDKMALEKQIIAHCERHFTTFEILFTSKDGDYSFLKEKIVKEEITDIVICGGDGSVGPVVSSLIDMPVNVGIIPLGSGNGLARSAGIPNSVDKALAIIFTGIPRCIDAFTVNNRLGCQITGFGFDAFVAGEFSKERKRGLATYTKLAIKHFFKAKPYHFEFEIENKTEKAEAFIFCISNANQFGNNVKIAPQASLNDGMLDVVILKKTTKINILISFVQHVLFSKKNIKPDRVSRQNNIEYFNAAKVRLINKNLAPVHIDGDPLQPEKEYLIQILPSAYKLIHPA